jgi:hypothetical protein
MLVRFGESCQQERLIKRGGQLSELGWVTQQSHLHHFKPSASQRSYVSQRATDQSDVVTSTQQYASLCLVSWS